MRTFTNLSERAHYCTSPDYGVLTGTLLTANGFSNGIQMTPHAGVVATRGTWAGVITVQFSTDNATWFTLATYTANFSKTIDLGMKAYFRVGMLSHTSGTANYLLGMGY